MLNCVNCVNNVKVVNLARFRTVFNRRLWERIFEQSYISIYNLLTTYLTSQLPQVKGIDRKDKMKRDRRRKRKFVVGLRVGVDGRVTFFRCCRGDICRLEGDGSCAVSSKDDHVPGHVSLSSQGVLPSSLRRSQLFLRVGHWAATIMAQQATALRCQANGRYYACLIDN